MWAAECPEAGPAPSARRADPAAAPSDCLRRDGPRAPSSLGSSPGLGSGSFAPDSLGGPGESPSVQCDSLECPCCCPSVGSAPACEDSLRGPRPARNGRACCGAQRRNPRASGDLSDSLESPGAPHDSLQSVSSLRESFGSSGVRGDSLESLSSLSSGSSSHHSGFESPRP